MRVRVYRAHTCTSGPDPNLHQWCCRAMHRCIPLPELQGSGRPADPMLPARAHCAQVLANAIDAFKDDFLLAQQRGIALEAEIGNFFPRTYGQGAFLPLLRLTPEVDVLAASINQGRCLGRMLGPRWVPRRVGASAACVNNNRVRAIGAHGGPGGCFGCIERRRLPCAVAQHAPHKTVRPMLSEEAIRGRVGRSSCRPTHVCVTSLRLGPPGVPLPATAPCVDHAPCVDCASCMDCASCVDCSPCVDCASLLQPDAAG